MLGLPSQRRLGSPNIYNVIKNIYCNTLIVLQT